MVVVVVVVAIVVVVVDELGRTRVVADDVAGEVVVGETFDAPVPEHAPASSRPTSSNAGAPELI